MPKRRSVWSSWNYLGAGPDAPLCVTYWMNRLQGLLAVDAAVRDAESAIAPPRDGPRLTAASSTSIRSSISPPSTRSASSGRCRACAAPGSAAPISAPAFTRTDCRPASPSPSSSAACGGPGRVENESGRIHVGPAPAGIGADDGDEHRALCRFGGASPAAAESASAALSRLLRCCSISTSYRRSTNSSGCSPSTASISSAFARRITFRPQRRSAQRGRVDLARRRLEARGGAIRLLTMPRILGYAFNPLSIFFCYRRDGALQAILYEVNNTFGAASLLISFRSTRDRTSACATPVRSSSMSRPSWRWTWPTPSAIKPPDDAYTISISVADDAGDMLIATQHLARRTLDDRALLRVFLTHPLLTLKVIAGIHYEALLIWLKGVRLHVRPPPPDRPVTVVASKTAKRKAFHVRSDVPRHTGSFACRAALPGAAWGSSALVLRKVLAAMDKGRLIFVLPDGTRVDCRGQSRDRRRQSSFTKCRRCGGCCSPATSPSRKPSSAASGAAPISLPRSRLRRSMATPSCARWRASRRRRFANWLMHRLRANSRAGSRRNIAAHYDLGNEFYRLWLDPQMFYSSGIYPTGDETLEEAQQQQDRPRARTARRAQWRDACWRSAAAGAVSPPRWRRRARARSPD